MYTSAFEYTSTDTEDVFKELVLTEIDSFFLQNFINGFTESEHFRTAKKIYNLLSPCFDYAVADGVLDRNPMAKVVIPIAPKRGSFQ